MTVFEIRDSSIRENRNDKLIGILYYFERHERFYIELLNEIDEWDGPAMFMKKIREGVRSIDHVSALKWVNERIIPRERQNLGAILRDNGLKEYNEYRMLMLSEGRGSMDEEYIKKISQDKIPQEISGRDGRKVRDLMTLSSGRLLLFFNDGKSGIVDPRELAADDPGFLQLLKDEVRFRNARLCPGGFGVEWDFERFILYEKLYESAKDVGIAYDDVLRFAHSRIVSTGVLCEELGVSRQYIAQLTESGRLEPFVQEGNTKTYLRAQTEI